MEGVYCPDCGAYDTRNTVMYYDGYQINECKNCHADNLEAMILPEDVQIILQGFGRLMEVEKRLSIADTPVQPRISLIHPEVCSICLTGSESYESAPVEAETMCRHKFHLKCLAKWFTHSQRNECPFCRRQAYVWLCFDCAASIINN